MKIFKDKEVSKNWSIKLEDNGCGVNAVDSITGEFLAALIKFFDDGDIVTCTGSHGVLQKKGYDPIEHNNKFNELDGSIEIKKGSNI